jgi:hypothetical protein
MKTLSARLAALEKHLPAPPHRVIRLVCNDGDAAKAVALAKSEGFDEVSGDTCIIRLIVAAAGRVRAPQEPRIIGKVGEWRAAYGH